MLKIVGADHKVNPATIPYTTMWQYWLGKNNPKKLSKCFQKVVTEFKK